VASSPEPAPVDGRPVDARPSDAGVRWPLVAKIGVVLAVLTVVAALVAAVIAAFVVDRDDDAGSLGCGLRLTVAEQVFDTGGDGSCGAARRVGAQF
jgi:hypothetical protein